MADADGIIWSKEAYEEYKAFRRMFLSQRGVYRNASVMIRAGSDGGGDGTGTQRTKAIPPADGVFFVTALKVGTDGMGSPGNPTYDLYRFGSDVSDLTKLTKLNKSGPLSPECSRIRWNSAAVTHGSITMPAGADTAGCKATAGINPDGTIFLWDLAEGVGTPTTCT